MDLTFDIPTLVGVVFGLPGAYVAYKNHNAQKEKERAQKEKERNEQIQHVILDWTHIDLKEWGVRVSNYSSTAIFDLKIVLKSNGQENTIKLPCVRPGDFFVKNEATVFPDLIPVSTFGIAPQLVRSGQYLLAATCRDIRKNVWEYVYEDRSWKLCEKAE